MSTPETIPEFQYCHPDGRLRTRLEMDQWLRKEVPKVHWLRLHAARTFKLPKNIAWDMREIVLRHWLLDEMIRLNLITGDQLGINVTTSNDEAELRQFTQRLVALIQAGQAVSPQHAEGVDMSGFTPPPPPVMGAPQPQVSYQPGPPSPPSTPPGPPGVPMGPPGYQVPQAGPPQYQQQPQPPMGPPGGYAPPPGVPAGPPAMQPQAPVGPPAGPGRRAKRAEAPSAAPVPPMAPPLGPSVGQPSFAPAGFQPVGPQITAGQPFSHGSVPVMQAAPAPAPTVDLSVVSSKLEQVLNHLQSLAGRNSVLEKKVEMLSMMNTILCRGLYQKQGSADVAEFLKELNIQLPQ